MESGHRQSTPPEGDANALVLVIEDEENASEGLVVELRARGMDGKVATSFEEASEALATCCPSAIVLDLMLPDGKAGGDHAKQCDPQGEHFGVCLLRLIRSGHFESSGLSRQIPVFVLTAVVDDKTIADVLALEPTEIFSKPESPMSVAEHIKLSLEDAS